MAYRLAGTTPVPVRLTTGITDGSYTEVLGDTLKDGDALIVEGPPADGGTAAPGGGLGLGQPARPPGGGSQRRGPF
jgi:hypothetical protein